MGHQFQWATFKSFLPCANAGLYPRGGGGYFSTVCGTGTCHFLGVLFQTVTELWVPFSQFLDISRNYGCPFQGIFDNFRNYGPRYSFDLWNYGPKIQQNLRNYGYQFFGQNGTSPSHKRLSYPPPPSLYPCTNPLNET